MNRTDDLRRTMDYRIGAACASPPVEFAILDYNSGDDLAEYAASLVLPAGVSLTYRRYTGRAYWHTAHWLFDRFPPMPGWPADWRELKAGPHA